jgi:hypothetical protein
MKTHTDRHAFCFVSEYRTLQVKESTSYALITQPARFINVPTRTGFFVKPSYLQHEIRPDDPLHFLYRLMMA